MTVRRRQEQPSRLPFVLSILAAAAGVALLWVHFPGLPLTLVCLTVAGTVHPAPVLTGRQGAGVGRRPVPVTSAEKRALARHARLRRLRSLPLPLGQWPVQTSGVAGVGAALVAGSLQVSPTGWAPWLPSWGPWANGVAAFLLVSGLERVWRQTRGGSEPGPGTPVALLASASRCQLVVVLVSIVVGVGCGVATCASLRSWVSSPGLTCTGAALVGAAFGVWVTCRRRSWRPWRLRETARRQWERRWTMTPKEDQPPELVDRLVDGPLTVDVFRARPGRDLSYYVKARSQLAAAVGGGANVRVLPAPVVNGAGEPEPGTVDPALFQVAVLAAGADEEQVDDLGLAAAFQWAGRWDGVPKVEPAPVFVSRELVGPYTVDTFDSPGRPSAEMLRASDRLAVGVGAGLSAVVIPVQEEGLPGSIHPTRFRVAVCAPGTQVDVAEADEDVVRVRLECFLTQAADYLHQDVVALAGLELLTVDGPRVWLVELGDSLSASRLAGLMRQVAPALVDGTAIILGSTEVGGRWRDPGMADHVADLRVAAEWTAHFSEVIKAGDTPPVAQAGWLEELDAGGVSLYRLPFASPQGKDIARDYLRLGQRLRTTMPQAPFLLITAIPPTEGASAPGARSDKFFEVVWSTHPVASSPADLAPSGSASFSSIDPRDGATLVLAGMVDAAFRSVFRDDQAPQTVGAECLTTRAPWIWRVSVRLYGGLGMADLRRRADRIAALMRADWIRVRADGDLVDLFVGARPATCEVAAGYERTVAELDFEQAWVDAKVLTAAGEVPRMESMVPLDGNAAVTVYTFRLPAGISGADVRDGLGKVASTTGAGFLQVATQDNPSKVVLMSAARNPIPVRARYDFESADALVGQADRAGSALSIPWGTGVDGRPVTWRVKDTPHALVLGITGTGKSVALLAAVYAALRAGWDGLVIDPVKGGADFAGLRPWLRGMGGGGVAEADAMMRAVWAEVTRRKQLVASHGAPDVDHLPDDVRPPHVLVAVDEFTSLMLHEPVRRTRTTDPEVLAEYERAERENAQRASIGSLAGRVAREARSSGVHLLLGTQVLKADTIAAIPGGDLKNNLGRLLLGTPTQGERLSGLRQPEAAPVLAEAPIGRGVWEATTDPAVEVQTWYATAEEYAQALKRRDVAYRDDWDVDAYMPAQEASAYTEIDLGGDDVEVLDELVLDEL